MRTVGVVPARWHSRRWPGKALAEVNGRPLVEWAWLTLTRTEGIAEVVVATDDRRISDWARRAGARSVITSPQCRNGTERVAEVARSLSADAYVNVQADQVALEPVHIQRLIAAMQENPWLPMVTLARQPGPHDSLADRDAVFASLREDGTALRFWRGGSAGAVPAEYYRHLGVYAYRDWALTEYGTLPETETERLQSLEQLRGLDAGWSIGVEVVCSDARSYDRAGSVRSARNELTL
jgi:3-deoxy-manno-octulosonate cytidylyltransferase (CMP-KDO synthetase)